MSTKRHPITRLLQHYLQIDEYDASKIVFSAITLFCIIGSYSMLRSLKTSVFLGFVGREYEPYAKVFSILIMIPVMLFYAKILDRLKRYHTVYFFMGFYAVACLVFAYYFAHPVYGVQNTQTSPYRLVGWLFEFFMDLFQALVLGTYWSFINSISTPIFAGRGYPLIVAASRVGGILTTLAGWFIMEWSGLNGCISIPLLTASNSILLLIAIYCTYRMQVGIPEDKMHGYEAAYQVEQKVERSKKSAGVFEGLRLMLTEPYVLGIFGLVFSYEIINIIFDYQMHVLMSIETNNQVHAMTSYMLFYTGSWQTLSFFFALFGATKLASMIGINRGLLIMPIVAILLAILPLLSPTFLTIFIVMVIMRALNYGINHPLREMLFIPTVKDIKFKSKAWIDSFGRTLSKTTGSTLNILSLSQSPYLLLAMQSLFACSVALVWVFIAVWVGKIYSKTLKNNAVIGQKGT